MKGKPETGVSIWEELYFEVTRAFGIVRLLHLQCFLNTHTLAWRMIGECMVGLFTVRNPKYFQVNQYLIWRIMFQLWWGADGTCFNILTLNVHLIRCIWISFINSVRTKMGREGVQHKSLVYIRPAEKFWVVTPQTPLKLLSQNLFGDHFWGRSEAGKLWPQAILCPRATPMSAPYPLDLK